jgi:hypothetical protein
MRLHPRWNGRDTTCLGCDCQDCNCFNFNCQGFRCLGMAAVRAASVGLGRLMEPPQPGVDREPSLLRYARAGARRKHRPNGSTPMHPG